MPCLSRFLGPQHTHTRGQITHQISRFAVFTCLSLFLSFPRLSLARANSINSSVCRLVFAGSPIWFADKVIVVGRRLFSTQDWRPIRSRTKAPRGELKTATPKISYPVLHQSIGWARTPSASPKSLVPAGGWTHARDIVPSV